MSFPIQKLPLKRFVQNLDFQVWFDGVPVPVHVFWVDWFGFVFVLYHPHQLDYPFDRMDKLLRFFHLEAAILCCFS